MILAPLLVKFFENLQGKQLHFVETLANIIPDISEKVSKIKCSSVNQQTLNKIPNLHLIIHIFSVLPLYIPPNISLHLSFHQLLSQLLRMTSLTFPLLMNSLLIQRELIQTHHID